MLPHELTEQYRRYIDCLNRQDWASLSSFVADDVEYNGERVGLPGYRSMVEGIYRDIPDLAFHIELLAAEPPQIAARLAFDVTPKAEFLGLPINGKNVKFAENVFYTFADGKITRVWSILDKAAIEAQLR